MFSIDQLGLIKSRIEKTILNERMKYNDIYNVIDEYIISNSAEDHLNDKKNILMLGGLAGLDLLLNKERTVEHFVYELYTESSLYHSYEISNLLAKHIKKTKKLQIVRLQTVIAYRVYLIHVDNRPLIYIYTIEGSNTSIKSEDKRQYIPAFNLIQPISKSLFGKKNVYVIPPEIHLIDLYRSLYSPFEAGQWDQYVEIAAELMKLMENRKEILGGDENEDPKLAQDETKKITPKERSSILDNLMKEYVYNNPKIILLGEHALSLIYDSENLGELKTTTPVINVISYNDLHSDIDKIKKIVKDTLGRETPVIYISRGLKIMKDYRIQRITIKIGGEYDQKEVLYIYNSCHYDLIPFNKFIQYEQFVQVASPYVILRFFLIDIWIIRWIKEIGGIQEDFAKKRLKNIYNNIMDIQKYIKLEIGDSLINVFQKDRYVGIYISDKNAQKIDKQSGKQFGDYMPQEYYIRFKDYKTIDKK